MLPLPASLAAAHCGRTGAVTVTAGTDSAPDDTPIALDAGNAASLRGMRPAAVEGTRRDRPYSKPPPDPGQFNLSTP